MVELGVRYRAFRTPVTIIYRDGRVVQLKPFQSIILTEAPAEIDGKLTRLWFGRPVRERKR
jgi:hypothetical protein